MTDEAFQGLIRTVSEEWDIEFGAERRAVWYEALKHIPDKAVGPLITAILRTCRYAPHPADFCDAFADLVVGDDDAEAQWEAVKRIAHGTTLKDSGLSARGIQALKQATGHAGWWELEYSWGRASEITIAAWRKAFIEAYRKTHRSRFNAARIGIAQRQLDGRKGPEKNKEVVVSG